ncbi:MAG: EF-P beta-lysylation protein EpmB [Methylomicrobium sp.]|nr:EF-P beta-lysylation protein EpmB [Methylomicrobium sp.]
MTKNHPPLGDIRWQHELADAFKSIEDLCKFLHLDAAQLPVSEVAAKQFVLRVPRGFAECMQKGDANDPLLRQALPLTDELLPMPGFSDDPVGDKAAAKDNLVIHKYESRALMINTGACAINCRYCFRRNFPYSDYQVSKEKQDQALTYIKNDIRIKEVILSGGDPLLLSDERLAGLMQELGGIDHVKRIRIHSRLPIVLPSRITGTLLDILTSTQATPVMVVHCNHANEISQSVAQACRLIKDYGITLLNQSVLLKGVNDTANDLCTLSERLFENGIIPYYLHSLDKANGTQHFEVSEEHALKLIQQIQDRLPGYLVPKLVKEIAGAPSKKSLSG